MAISFRTKHIDTKYHLDKDDYLQPRINFYLNKLYTALKNLNLEVNGNKTKSINFKNIKKEKISEIHT
jgi:hypothetical protein